MQPAPGAVVSEIVSSTGFGFMTMERDGSGWSMRAWDYDGKPITTCTVAARKAVCTPIVNTLTRAHVRAEDGRHVR